MSVSQRNFVARAGFGFVIVLATVAVLGSLSIFLLWQMRPAIALAKQQAALLDGVERRSPARIRRLVAEDYGDRWSFTREDLVVAMVDAGGQFFALVVTPEEERIEIQGKRATVACKLVVSGKPVGPVGQEVTRQINRLGQPFVFTWEKRSFLPSGWRLVRLENAALPDDLFGYEPGDIGRAMRGE